MRSIRSMILITLVVFVICVTVARLLGLSGEHMRVVIAGSMMALAVVYYAVRWRTPR